MKRKNYVVPSMRALPLRPRKLCDTSPIGGGTSTGKIDSDEELDKDPFGFF